MNHTPLHDQLVSILSRNREDSYATQRKRGWCLAAAARAIVARFGLQKWGNLKLKHVTWLVDRWKAKDTGRRSIAEKLTYLRWMLHKIGKPILLPRTNEELGITPGPRHTRAGKAIPDEKLSEILKAISDGRIKAMILLGRHVGLRFKEASLFRPWRDWAGGRMIRIRRGTKGGRPRFMYIHEAKQVEALQAAREATRRDEALIRPEEPTFKTWARSVYAILRPAGLSRAADTVFQDLRRTYAIERMDSLISAGMTPAAAATLVARELGHNRTEVLAWYVSRAA